MADVGCKPFRSRILKNECREVTQSPTEVKARWYQHLINILNILSKYNEDTIKEMEQKQIRWDLNESQSEEEVVSALYKLKKYNELGISDALLPFPIFDGQQISCRHSLSLF